jgi:rhodanese-related sulfurtransferase
VKRALQEGALVALIGAALAFGANALAPHGLQLSKNYFPGAKLGSPIYAGSNNLAGATAAKTNTPLELLSIRLRESGLQLADSNQVALFFHDPRREQDGVVFIDARKDEDYQAGHIPGAYHFDRFRPENYLTNVLPVCLTAQQIVFYCNGGECDDSEHAAIMLRDSIGIPNEKLFVYGGGIAEWGTNGLPIELGVRNSGQFTNRVSPAVGGGKPVESKP